MRLFQSTTFQIYLTEEYSMFKFTEEQTMIRDMVREFTKTRWSPATSGWMKTALITTSTRSCAKRV